MNNFSCFNNFYNYIRLTRSSSAAFGSFAFTIPDASKTPTEPSSSAAFISSPVERRCDKWFSIIRALFEDNGAHIEVINAKEHDRFVSVVQGLTHFAYITIGTTFKRLDFDVNESRRFMSPVYEIMVDFVGRILGQNPYLYALIQMENPEVQRVHEAFREECMS